MALDRLPTRRRRRLAAAVLAAAVGVGVLGGCGTDQTGRPGPVEADFTPRLVVTVDEGGLTASVGPKGQGDPLVSADPARLPAGSVMEVRTADGTQRVVGVLTPPGEEPADLNDRDTSTPAPLVDTGVQPAGSSVTVVLSTPGTLRLRPQDRPEDVLEVEITPRPAT